MTVEEIEQILIDGIASITGQTAEGIAVDQPFHQLGVDSLGFVEILVFIEKQFHLQLIAADLTREDFACVKSLANYISDKLQAPP